MIRATRTCKGLAFRAVGLASQHQSCQMGPSESLSIAQSICPTKMMKFSTGTNIPTSTSGDVGGGLPPNLTFDRRSSFAPKEASTVLVPPVSSTAPAESMVDELEESDEKEDYDSESDVDFDEEFGDVEDSDEERNVTQALTHVADDGPRHVIPLPHRLNTNVYHGLDGTVSGTLWLDPSVFGADPIRIDLMKQSVDYIRNKIRGRRKAKSKTISEVSGSGRKVRQQKGTGQARAGHSRPAHWRGGAKAHGPKNVVDYGDVKMNRRAKRLAIVSALSQKLKEGNLIVVDNFRLSSHKTSPWSRLLEHGFGIGRGGNSALILDHYLELEEAREGSESADAAYRGVPINLWVASANIKEIKVANQRFANVYDILKKEKLILTISALEQIEGRWKTE